MLWLLPGKIFIMSEHSKPNLFGISEHRADIVNLQPELAA